MQANDAAYKKQRQQGIFLPQQVVYSPVLTAEGQKLSGGD